MDLFNSKSNVEGLPVNLVIGNIKEVEKTLVRTTARLERLKGLEDRLKAGLRSADRKAKRKLRESIAVYTAQKKMLETVLNLDLDGGE